MDNINSVRSVTSETPDQPPLNLTVTEIATKLERISDIACFNEFLALAKIKIPGYASSQTIATICHVFLQMYDAKDPYLGDLVTHGTAYLKRGDIYLFEKWVYQKYNRFIESQHLAKVPIVSSSFITSGYFWFGAGSTVMVLYGLSHLIAPATENLAYQFVNSNLFQ